MTSITTFLESMGLTLSSTSDGNLSLEGLKRLTTTQRQQAIALAKENKPAILEELAGRKSKWIDICPDYWRGCFSCPHVQLEKLDFCKSFRREGRQIISLLPSEVIQ